MKLKGGDGVGGSQTLVIINVNFLVELYIDKL